MTRRHCSFFFFRCINDGHLWNPRWQELCWGEFCATDFGIISYDSWCTWFRSATSHRISHVKPAKMCIANRCHLTPRSQVWVPVRDSGALMTSDLWVSHLFASSFSDGLQKIFTCRARNVVPVCEKWTGVCSRPCRQLHLDVNGAWFFAGYYFDLISVADWPIAPVQLQTSLQNKLKTLN